MLSKARAGSLRVVAGVRRAKVALITIGVTIGDESAHSVQIDTESPASGRRQVNTGHRLADEKTLLDGHVTGVFEFPQVYGKIALRGPQQVLQLIKLRNFALMGQIRHDAEPEPPVNYVVNLANIERGHVIDTSQFVAGMNVRMNSVTHPAEHE
jgi:hypothetical protein